MRIGNVAMSAYSFYDSASRANSINNASRVAQVQAPAEVNKNDDSKSEVVASSAIYQREDYAGPKRTELSPELSYNKNRIDDSQFNINRMADKLMSSLPNIMKDMQNVPDMDNALQLQDTLVGGQSKVVITEASNVDYNGAQANPALQDISL